jgi:hypothetical protein
MDVTTLVNNFVRVIVNPAILLLFAVALIIFLWGLVQFLISLNVTGKDTNKGKQHMLWGLIGMFIMVAAYGIFAFLSNTICSINSATCIVR